MGRIVISTNVTLDGVSQDPTGEEGTSVGGWFLRISASDREAWAALESAEAANTAAFNVGNTLGPVLGGLVISAGHGYASPSWIALTLLLGSILLGVAGWWQDPVS